jgi:hypothetical protein
MFLADFFKYRKFIKSVKGCNPNTQKIYKRKTPSKSRTRKKENIKLHC